MTNFDYSMCNLDDIIQVEDLTDRLNWLEGHEPEELPEDEANELIALTKLVNELQGMGGDHQWRGEWYPASLIRDSYFEEAMDEMVADCYALPELPSFMTITLDYAALQQDYSSVDVDGVTYWCRLARVMNKQGMTFGLRVTATVRDSGTVDTVL